MSFTTTFCSQGERILTLAEMCRKLETEEEKVTIYLGPFSDDSVTACHDCTWCESYRFFRFIHVLWRKKLKQRLLVHTHNHPLNH